MAEVAGLALGVLGIAGLFTSCIENFDIIVRAKDFGEEFDHQCTKVSQLLLVTIGVPPSGLSRLYSRFSVAFGREATIGIMGRIIRPDIPFARTNGTGAVQSCDRPGRREAVHYRVPVSASEPARQSRCYHGTIRAGKHTFVYERLHAGGYPDATGYARLARVISEAQGAGQEEPEGQVCLEGDALVHP